MIEEWEAIDADPVITIKKMPVTRRVRPTLSVKQRKDIDAHLKKRSRTFWRFMQIFFHSGSRETELLALKGKDVDLENQRFLRLIKKGKQAKEEWTVIKDIALPFWEDVMQTCGSDQFVFSRLLKPGPIQINSKQIGRKWRRYIKQELGIDVDFYALKHLHTTETRDALSEGHQADRQVAAHHGHSGTAMVVNIYDTKHKQREQKKIQEIQNSFAPAADK